MSVMRKHYPTLTANERFRMAIAALARKDDDDLALLRQTCLWKTYEATDHAFQGQWEQSARVVRYFATMWLTTLVHLCEASARRKYYQAAHAYYREGYIAGGNATWEEAGHTDAYLVPEDFVRYSRTPEDDTRKPDEWERAYIGWCIELKTLWVSWTRFCADVRFTPEELLGWWSTGEAYLERGKAIIASDLPVHEDEAEELCASFQRLWDMGQPNEWGERTMRGKAHGPETQAKVLAAFLTGETVTAAAAVGGVSRATAREWWGAFRKTEEYRELCRMVMERFATKKEEGATVAPLFDFTAVRDTRYGYQGG